MWKLEDAVTRYEEALRHCNSVEILSEGRLSERSKKILKIFKARVMMVLAFIKRMLKRTGGVRDLLQARSLIGGAGDAETIFGSSGHIQAAPGGYVPALPADHVGVGNLHRRALCTSTFNLCEIEICCLEDNHLKRDKISEVELQGLFTYMGGEGSRSEGKHKEVARERAENCLDRLKKFHGECHPQVAKGIFNIAMKDYKELVSMYCPSRSLCVSREEVLMWHKEALEIRKKTLGDSHLLTATSYFAVAKVTKPIREKLELAYKALEIRKQVLGEHHLLTKSLYKWCKKEEKKDDERMKARLSSKKKEEKKEEKKDDEWMKARLSSTPLHKIEEVSRLPSGAMALALNFKPACRVVAPVKEKCVITVEPSAEKDLILGDNEWPVSAGFHITSTGQHTDTPARVYIQHSASPGTKPEAFCVWVKREGGPWSNEEITYGDCDFTEPHCVSFETNHFSYFKITVVVLAGALIAANLTQPGPLQNQFVSHLLKKILIIVSTNNILCILLISHQQPGSRCTENILAVISIECMFVPYLIIPRRLSRRTVPGSNAQSHKNLRWRREIFSPSSFQGREMRYRWR